MAKKKKIFILYARFGDGHWQAATALRQSFERLGRTEVKLIDLLAESHPSLTRSADSYTTKATTFFLKSTAGCTTRRKA